MQVECSKEDIIALIKGYDPFKYDLLLNKFCTYYDQYGRFEWEYGIFDNWSEEQLYDLLTRLRNFVPKKSTQELLKGKQRQEILEIQHIYEDGVRRNCQSQINAAAEELSRLRGLYNEHD
jgi:hypothetical protein